MSDSLGNSGGASVWSKSVLTVASIRPREGVRYRDSVKFTFSYTLADGASRDVRIRPSVVIFPVWSFGTVGHVDVELPREYEVLVDGDSLVADRSGESLQLKSGTIENHPLTVSAAVTRVPVHDGHTGSVSVALEQQPDPEAMIAAWNGFRGKPQELGLPSAPRLQQRSGRPFSEKSAHKRAGCG